MIKACQNAARRKAAILHAKRARLAASPALFALKPRGAVREGTAQADFVSLWRRRHEKLITS
jgi:hypothetical protein